MVLVKVEIPGFLSKFVFGDCRWSQTGIWSYVIFLPLQLGSSVHHFDSISRAWKIFSQIPCQEAGVWMATTCMYFIQTAVEVGRGIKQS